MAIELQGQKIAFLATDGVEQVELKEPWKAVADAGGEPELLSIKEERSRGSTTCADVVRDRTLTSWPSLRTDIRNAGGNWVDEEVVVDGGLVSSRRPDDLPAFCVKIVELFADGAPSQPAEKTSASR